MQRISFDLSDILLRQMDNAVINEGFQSRSEFLRFLIMTHTKKITASLPGDAVKKEEAENEFADIDLEYGVPPELIEKYERMAKAKN